MVTKKAVINLLMLASFPLFGIGNYVSATMSPTLGFLVGSSAWLAIIAFYVLDAIYIKNLVYRVNGNFWLMVLVLASSVFALLYANYRGFPGMKWTISIASAITLCIPFPAFVITYLYNQKDPDKVLRIVGNSIILLLLANVVGYYGLGLSNQGHSLEGRLNLPFFGGLYSAANLVATINLILLASLRHIWHRPSKLFSLKTIMMGFYFMANLLVIFYVNSRLVTVVFLLVVGLFIFKCLRSRVLYWTSWAMIPLLLSMGVILYQILSMPVFAFLLQRVDFEDVVTFHGRSYLWERGLEWLFTDARGILFGNGQNGQYWLGLLTDIGRMWNPEAEHGDAYIHFHSTTLELLVNNGLFGFLPYAILLYRLLQYYRKEYVKGTQDGLLLIAQVFTLFTLQVSMFYYAGGFGFILFALMVSRISLTGLAPSKPLDDAPRSEVLEPAEEVVYGDT